MKIDVSACAEMLRLIYRDLLVLAGHGSNLDTVSPLSGRDHSGGGSGSGGSVDVHMGHFREWKRWIGLGGVRVRDCVFLTVA
jgi:hypothetical protein